jgi:hypothetical protein
MPDFNIILKSNIFEGFEPTLLCHLMVDYLSDKGTIMNKPSFRQHNYSIAYNEFFKNDRQKAIRLFELGLGTNNLDVLSNMGPQGRPGASLRGWRDYFPYGQIYGADIDKRILFEDSRIKTFYCDQTDPQTIAELWSNPELNENFDIIIEDGLHTFDANICFFENSIHKLNKGGLYIIEDIYGPNIPQYVEKFEEYEKTNRFPNLLIKIYSLPHQTNRDGNNIIVIKKLQ